MAETTYDLLVEALTDLGVLADGEQPSASQAQGALSKLNSMLDAWRLEKLLVYGSTGNVFPLVPGQATYTVGTGGNFNIPRPANISAVYLRNNNVPVADQMDIPVWTLTNEQWEAYSPKTMTGSLPVVAWVNDTYPLSSITLSPIPSDSTYNLVVWTDGLLGGLLLNQSLLFPPGYREAIVANLVMRLAPGYKMQPSDITGQLAVNGKDLIRATNLQVNILHIDPRLTNMPYPRSTFVGGQW